MREKILKIINYKIGIVPIIKIVIVYEILFWIYNYMYQPFLITGSWHGLYLEDMWYERMFTIALGVPFIFILIVFIWYKIPKK